MDNKEKKTLDYFGNLLMQNVRDESINYWNRIFNGKMKSKDAQKFYDEFKIMDSKQKQFMFEVISEIVDTVLYNLLWSLEQEENVNVFVKVEDDREDINIREISDGLAGELYTEDGWISRFSKK